MAGSLFSRFQLSVIACSSNSHVSASFPPLLICHSVLLLFLVTDIEDLPPAVQEKLFDEVLDRDVQKGEIFTRSSQCRGNTYHMLRVHMEAIVLRGGKARSKMKIVWRLAKQREPLTNCVL